MLLLHRTVLVDRHLLRAAVVTLSTPSCTTTRMEPEIQHRNEPNDPHAHNHANHHSRFFIIRQTGRRGSSGRRRRGERHLEPPQGRIPVRHKHKTDQRFRVPGPAPPAVGSDTRSVSPATRGLLWPPTGRQRYSGTRGTQQTSSLDHTQADENICWSPSKRDGSAGGTRRTGRHSTPSPRLPPAE